MQNVGVFSSFLNTAKSGQSKFYYDTIFKPIIKNIHDNTDDKYTYFLSLLTERNTSKFLEGQGMHFKAISFNMKDYSYKNHEYYENFRLNVRDKLQYLDMEYCFVICSPYLPVFPRNKTNYDRFKESGKTPIIGHIRRNFFTEIVIEELSRVTKVIYLPFDPNEEGFKDNEDVVQENIIKKYFYDYDDFSYFPYYEKEFKEKKVKKKYDISFSTLLLTPERKRYNLNRLEKIKNNLDESDDIKDNFYYFTDKTKDDLIPKEKYDKLVKASKFTYTLPSYNSTHFSYPRFYDGIIDQTIPLIDDRVNIDILKNNHPHWYNFIKDNNLIVDGDNFVDVLRSLDYDKLNREAMDICRMVYKKEEFKKHYDRLLDEISKTNNEILENEKIG